MNHPALEIDYDPSDELKLRYEILSQQQPSLRARDAAKQLSVTEAELVACRAGDSTFHMVDRPEAILNALETVGEVLVVTRNENTILESKGFYKNIAFSNQKGLLTAHCSGTGLELRLLLNNWHYGFLVIDEKHIGRSKSLQFFDNEGQAIQKIYLTQNALELAFEKIISRFISSYQPTYLDISKEKPCLQNQPDKNTEWHKIRKSWKDTQSSHHFFQQLIGSKVTRQQAYDNVSSDLAYEIVPNALQHLFILSEREECGLTFAVENSGSIQIHSNKIQRINEYGSWLNILDQGFNLHINTHKIAQAWVIRKPHKGGQATSVEFFDDNDQLVLQITAERNADMPEPTQWRDLVAQLQPRSLNASALNIYDASLPDGQP